MTEHDSHDSDTLQAILDVLVELASGNADARLPAPEGEGPLDMIAVAINMFAEERALVLQRERELRVSLEQKIAELERSQELVARQHQSIRELSTPVIEIWRGVLALPLIGLVDSERGEQIMEQLLDAIMRKRAKTAIIDLTGLATLDTLVAQKLLDAVSAVGLLGARVILTGISPDNAQTMVRLGVDFGEVTTASTLQAGLALAVKRPPR